MNIQKLTFEAKPKWPEYKSGILWAHTYRGMTPLCYFRKPKHVCQEIFDELLKSISIQVSSTFADKYGMKENEK